MVIKKMKKKGPEVITRKTKAGEADGQVRLIDISGNNNLPSVPLDCLEKIGHVYGTLVKVIFQ